MAEPDTRLSPNVSGAAVVAVAAAGVSLARFVVLVSRSASLEQPTAAAATAATAATLTNLRDNFRNYIIAHPRYFT